MSISLYFYRNIDVHLTRLTNSTCLLTFNFCLLSAAFRT